MTNYGHIEWQSVLNVPPLVYVCGYCGKTVGPNRGFYSTSHAACRIYLCSLCCQPSYFDVHGTQYPGVAYGNNVDSLPINILNLYNEARSCMSVNAYTASVLACRKLLMNIGVAQGAPANQSFVAYVEHLANNGFIPPNGRAWVDHIRKKGNEATHEIQLMSEADAKELLIFVEMLLKLVFEFPSRVPQSP